VDPGTIRLVDRSCLEPSTNKHPKEDELVLERRLLFSQKSRSWTKPWLPAFSEEAYTYQDRRVIPADKLDLANSQGCG
jgi:hypothetical protein